VPNTTKVDFFVLELFDFDDTGKAVQALDKGVFDRLAQGVSKTHELIGRQILIAEKNDLVLQQSGANGLLQIGREGLGQIHSVQLSAQCACDLSNDHRFIVAQALG
jgi:hypothetical protein